MRVGRSYYSKLSSTTRGGRIPLMLPRTGSVVRQLPQTSASTDFSAGSSFYSHSSHNTIATMMGSSRRCYSAFAAPVHQRHHRSLLKATTSVPFCNSNNQFFNRRAVINYQSTLASATYNQSVHTFPSIVIGPHRSIVPQGSFAQAQAEYLNPNSESVEQLRDALLATNMGVVAHYYMDVELQGVLQAVQQSHPLLQHRIGIADSLKMGDLAVQMCSSTAATTTTRASASSSSSSTTAGVSAVACLGVDFMSESVAAILQRNGYGHIPVYRASSLAIGCSLAESAERDSYRAWLQQESTSTSAYPLHVIYINTSLETKAVSSSLVPTITCTSSNVLQTILQASAQVGPNLKLLYGPDTYMGHNLVSMLSTMATDWTDERIRTELHPHHTRDTIRTLRDNMTVFPHGNCIVHHMFGQQVVEAVRNHYDHAFVTAHLEVPGEMFQIAMEKSMQGRGVVGSTSDILRFITNQVQQAATSVPNTNSTVINSSTSTTTNTPSRQRLQFILGTEAGMVTSIVKSVQDILDRTGNETVEAEIIFPVASDAIMSVDEHDVNNKDLNLSVVPGVSGGEGCSTAGGCATCPFMKMNDLDALLHVLEMVQRRSPKDDVVLQGHLPPNRLSGRRINGVDAMDLGTESILFMREFMKHKTLSPELMNKILKSTSTSSTTATTSTTTTTTTITPSSKTNTTTTTTRITPDDATSAIGVV